MLDFLKVPYDESDVRLKLSEGFETYHRNSSSVHFEHYTVDQKNVVQNVINSLIIELKMQNKDIGLENYLLKDVHSQKV